MESGKQYKKNATHRMRRPLKLRRETLRNLTPIELKQAAGGHDPEPPSTQSDCRYCIQC